MSWWVLGPALFVSSAGPVGHALGGDDLGRGPDATRPKPDGCTDSVVTALPDDQRAAACRLLASPAVTGPADVAAGPALADVYGRPEFVNARHRGGVTLKVLLARFLAWLESLFETAGAQTYSNITRVLVLIAAALVAAWFGLRVRSRRLAKQRLPRTEAGPAALLDPTLHWQRARARLAEDPREAIREGLSALLATLEQRRLARPERVRTNREVADELPARGASLEVTAQVSALLSWYDRVFYSQSAVSAVDAAEFLNKVAQFGEFDPAKVTGA